MNPSVKAGQKSPMPQVPPRKEEVARKPGTAAAHSVQLDKPAKLKLYEKLTSSFTSLTRDIHAQEQRIKDLQCEEKVAEAFGYIDSIATVSVFGPDYTDAPTKYPKANRDSASALKKVRDLAESARKRAEYCVAAAAKVEELEQLAAELLKQAANIRAEYPSLRPVVSPARGRLINLICPFCQAETALTKCEQCHTIAWSIVLTIVRSKSLLARQKRCKERDLSASPCTNVKLTTSPQQKTCSNCQNQIDRKMTFCPHCNKGAEKACKECQQMDASGPSGLCKNCARSHTPDFSGSRQHRYGPQRTFEPNFQNLKSHR